MFSIDFAMSNRFILWLKIVSILPEMKLISQLFIFHNFCLIDKMKNQFMLTPNIIRFEFFFVFNNKTNINKLFGI